MNECNSKQRDKRTLERKEGQTPLLVLDERCHAETSLQRLMYCWEEEKKTLPELFSTLKVTFKEFDDDKEKKEEEEDDEHLRKKI